MTFGERSGPIWGLVAVPSGFFHRSGPAEAPLGPPVAQSEGGLEKALWQSLSLANRSEFHYSPESR